MGWQAALRLDYDLADGRTRGHSEHSGPYRVLKALYPEGDAVCHHVLVHPPSGLVGGDHIGIRLTLAPGSHAVLTTPGATRFYRSLGDEATQTVEARVAGGARLEWLPLENLVYSGALAVNRQRFELDAGASMLGWDLLGLGLPASGAPFVAGRVRQRIEVAGLWLDAATIAADDALLLESAAGLEGRRAMATLWCAWGSAPEDVVVEALLDAAREQIALQEPRHPGRVIAGATRVHPQVVLLRAVADRIEPLVDLLRGVRRQWRGEAWGLPPVEPRVWGT